MCENDNCLIFMLLCVLTVMCVALCVFALSVAAAAYSEFASLVPSEFARRFYLRIFKWTVAFATWVQTLDTTIDSIEERLRSSSNSHLEDEGPGESRCFSVRNLVHLSRAGVSFVNRSLMSFNLFACTIFCCRVYCQFEFALRAVCLGVDFSP